MQYATTQTNPRGTLTSSQFALNPNIGKYATITITESSNNPAAYLSINGVEIVDSTATVLPAYGNIAWLVKITEETVTVEANGNCNIQWTITVLG